jgi:drug/metabolite transporter (DMT)-like permease
LRERANWKQWICFGASFVGVILVRGFDMRVTLFDLTLGVASATLSAVAYNLIRALRNEDHALVVMFYLPLVSLVTIGPWTAFHFVRPIGTEWLILIFIGVFTQIAQYFMTRAYQADSAANISNLNYLGILYATAIGFFCFDEKVMGMSLVGISIIVASAVLSTRFSSRNGP